MPPEQRPDPALREIIGALILGSDHPVSVREIRRVVEAVALDRQAERGEVPSVSDDELLALADRTSGEKPPAVENTPEDDSLAGASGVDGKAIKTAFAELRSQLTAAGAGIDVVEVAGGYRLQTSPDCGPWVRRMLNRGKPQRISRPMIETLAIIGYRQPIARSEIESIRGVSVGHVIKALMEMQLVRIVGRSDLPGRPFLFGTTATFLDHFGLKSLNELNEMQPGVARTPPAEQRAKHLRKRPPSPGESGPTGRAEENSPEELVQEPAEAHAVGSAEIPWVVSAEVKTQPEYGNPS